MRTVQLLFEKQLFLNVLFSLLLLSSSSLPSLPSSLPVLVHFYQISVKRKEVSSQHSCIITDYYDRASLIVSYLFILS
jgi:hypothetical protein